ncbi:MAG TPA: pentapeptide repeat-containing protein [Leptolyngbyaceae cyanobacterium]
MTTDPNSHQPNSPQTELPPENYLDNVGNGNAADNANEIEAVASAIAENQAQQRLSRLYQTRLQASQNATAIYPAPKAAYLVTIVAIGIMFFGIAINSFWIGISGAIVALLISFRVIWLPLVDATNALLTPRQQLQIFSTATGLIAIAGLLKFLGVYRFLNAWFHTIDWEAIGTLAEWTGAVGQIFIAVLAVYIAWQQYVISRDLTIEQNRLTSQQNTITQQQTIDAYFQGVSDLALGEEGLLEDWPQERVFAEGRTAALLGSIDATGKAKVLRFLSKSKLLTPLKRDQHLGRPLLDGKGGYEEDREYGVRVIDLGVMLAGANLSGTDLRWTDLSDANLVRANLTNCDLVKANLSRTVLFDTILTGSDLKGTRLFYGKLETATPRSRTIVPDYRTGAYTGAVVENADFTNVRNLSEEQRCYCCAWGGSKTRATIPGGCEGIPNKLGR